MPNQPVLYLGDTALTGAASYLTGLMTHWQWGYSYVPSNQPAGAELFGAHQRLFILSDYPAAMLDPTAQQRLVERVADGAGLIMIGGWDSFRGQSGHWDSSPVAEALPVAISSTDDRVNCDQPTLALKRLDHPITNGLPWLDRPPTIGGFNRIKPKAGCDVLLEAQSFAARLAGNGFDFQPRASRLLLAVSTHGRGRTAALATDIAPHWVGGLVDWGDGRVTAQAPGSHEIEVGDLYASFVRQMLTWTGRMDEPAH